MLDQEGGDFIRSVRVLNAEVPSVRHSVIGDLDHGEYDYINRVVLTLPFLVYEGTWATLSPLVAMHLLDRSCMIVGKFFEILCSSTVLTFNKDRP